MRTLEQLETEIAPALFTYGRRHYQRQLVSAGVPAGTAQEDMFDEETVRLFCGQVVCTVLDLLGDALSTEAMEAWIELMRYLGRALLNGFEYEKLASTRKFAINTRDHAYFLA